MTDIAFITDSLDRLNVKKDSTIAMLCAVQRRGWTPWVMQSKDLFWDGDVFGIASVLEIQREFARTRDVKDLGPDLWFKITQPTKRPLSSFEAIFMRKDPPFDMNYIYTTYMLELAESQGVLVVNKPSSLRNCNEKFYATHFPRFTPPMVVSQRADILKPFYEKHLDVVFKILDGMGGAKIFRIKEGDPNLNVIIETLTNYETKPIMAQKFIPEIEQGDKRILIVDGSTIPNSLARVPPEGETRANLATGGIAHAQPLSNRDWEIANALAPELKRRGLLFVGIDVIGDYLTEINVTCPTCIRELDNAYGLDIAGQLMDVVQQRLLQ